MKVAYLSADFREHPIGKFMRTIFASHNHHQFEIYCYVHKVGDDAITDEIRLASDHFIEITDLDDEALARQIHADGIHVLIEIGGQMAHSRLAALAWKPAPVQITYLAQPNTTGLPTVDFRITDVNSEAPGGTHYVEKQLYMPESFLCMGHLPDFDRIATTPAKNNGYITFCSFNGIRKFNPAVIAVWSKILKRVKKSRLVIKSPGTDVQIVRSNILKEFKRHGIGKDRLKFVGYCTFQEHADWHNKVDIALDSFPYNGTTTTFDTLWMGVPVITLVGKSHAQRTSYTILKNIGFDEAAAAFTPEEYVNKAVHLAKHPETLSFLRRCLPTMIRNSILFQPERFTSQLEDLYVRAWEEKMGTWLPQENKAISPLPHRCLRRQSPALTRSDQVNVTIFGNTVASSPVNVQAEKPKRIFIVGMPRSGTAWLHRAVTTIVQQHGEEDTPPKVQFLHALSGESFEAVQSDETVVLYTVRDLRDVAVGLMNIYDVPFNDILASKRLHHLLADDDGWMKLPHINVIAYEDIVHAQTQVIQSVGTYIGYKINLEDAESIVASCQRMLGADNTDHLPQDIEALQTANTERETSEPASEFANDLPGIYRNRLTLEQIGQLNVNLRSWLKKHRYITPSYPEFGAGKAIHIQIQDDLNMCLPATLNQKSTYILLEQEDWYEPEIHFLRQWISPSMRCVDIGAGFGCFALTMSSLVTSKGEVWACEPSAKMADMLHRSIVLNHLDHCHLIRVAASNETRNDGRICFEDDDELSVVLQDDITINNNSQITATASLDDLSTQHQWKTLDFVRIHVGERIDTVLEGGHCLLLEHSPLVMVKLTSSHRDQHDKVVQHMATMGYIAYQFAPNLAILMPYQSDTQERNVSSYIFFCKKDRATALRQGGHLVHAGMLKQTVRPPKGDVWQRFSCQFPYVETLASAWSQENAVNIPEHKAYIQILNMYATAWQKDTATPKRIAGLQHIFPMLSNLLEAYTNLPRLLTFARIAVNLGELRTARQALDSIIQHLASGNSFVAEEPFLTASSWAEGIAPGDHPAEWCLAQSIHARLQYCEASSWHTKTDEHSLLETFQQCGFPNAMMERRRQLILMRCYLQNKPIAHASITGCHTDNLNPEFWQEQPVLVEDPTWSYTQTVDHVPRLCSMQKSGNTIIKSVLEDYFQQPVPSTYTGDTGTRFNGNREGAVAIQCLFMHELASSNKLIYVHRDPRDVLVSMFESKYKKPCTEDTETFKSFAKKWAAIWKQNVEQALHHSGDTLLVAYTDLIAAPYETFAKIISFMDQAAIGESRLSTAITSTMEQQIVSETNAHDWQDILTTAQVMWIQDIIDPLFLETMDYPVETENIYAQKSEVAIAHNQVDMEEADKNVHAVEKYCEKNTAYWADFASQKLIQHSDKAIIVDCMVSISLPYMIGNLTIAKYIQREKELKVHVVIPENQPDWVVRLVKSFNVDMIFTECPFTPPGRKLDFEAMLQHETPAALREKLLAIEFNGLPVGDLIYDSYLREGHATIDKINKILIQHCEMALAYYYCFKDIIKKGNIVTAVIGHPIYVRFGMLLRLVLQNGGTVYSRTPTSGTLTIKQYTSVDQCKQFESYVPLSVFDTSLMNFSARESQVIDSYMQARVNYDMKKGMPNFAFSEIKETNHLKVYSKEALVTLLGLDIGKKTVCIMAHTFSDGPHCDDWMLYDDYYQWLIETLRIASKITDVNWLVKPHPCDSQYDVASDFFAKRVMHAVSKTPHISLVPDDAIFSSLFNIADGIVTIRGTAGIEFSSIAGIPVLVAGCAFYTGRGFTVEPRTIKEYETAMRTFYNTKLTSEQQHRARVCAYGYYFAALVHCNLMPVSDYDFFMEFDLEKSFTEALEALANASVEHDPLYQNMQIMFKHDLDQLMNFVEHPYLIPADKKYQ